MSNFSHTPVLLKEIVDSLKIEKGKKYIDATIGGGGHTVEILKHGGKVLGIDVDEDAIEYLKSKFKIEKDLILVKGNFREIDKIARLKGFDKVAGILLDLGVSSYQLENKERGFSFQNEGLLDMRMDKDLNVKALDLVNGLNKRELCELFIKLGEEYNARAIVEVIIKSRTIKPIETTLELSKIIEKTTKGFSKINPATKVFQALRIAVNDELNNLKEALPKAMDLLEKNGKLCVISFHSLEDRIVKNYFLQFQKSGKGNILTQKPKGACLEEIKINRRSRSAKLRVFEKK